MQEVKTRGPYAKGVAKREEVRQIALETFARRGYRGATLREIADEAGLTVAGVLHYFDSKEELFTEVLRLRDAAAVEITGPSPRDAAETLIRVVRHNATVPGLVHLYMALAVEGAVEGHPAQDYFQEHFASLSDWIEGEIRELQSDGRIKLQVQPEMLASIFMAAIDGLQLQWLHDPSIDMAERLSCLWNELILSPEQT
ncbi:TetR/AcrR family transcriptional regulator [Agromyces albus]|nr:TetR/AcrR family transcriptional regulator [Agromyces albus]